MAFIDDIVKFHSFSKSTVRTGLTLGEAVNPSGHTVISKQVRTDDIPWFVNSFQSDEAKARTWAASNATAARHNDILYYGAEFKVGFTAPKCLIYVSKQEVDGKLVDLPAEQCGWQTFDLNSVTTLKNADGKDVIAIHKNSKVEYVDGNNNAATNSNQQSLFVRRADGTLLDHFVSATDQIIAGQPSLGYSAVVSVGGKAIDEGEGSGNYIGNTYAGIVHFHAARNESKAADGSVNGITVTCFEYIGDKLDTALGNIDGKIQDIVGTTMEGVVASVGTTTAATNVGISVDSSTATSPKIDISTGTVGGDSDAKLVTGSAVKTYVDSATEKATVDGEGVVKEGDETKLVTATDAQNIATKAASDEIAAAISDTDGAIAGAIDGAISDATLGDGEKIATATDTTKLVTVEDVTTYVSENVKVTLTADTADGKTGITIDKNGQADTSFTIGIDQTIIATKDSVDDLSDLVDGVSQTVADIQTSLSTGSVGTAIQAAQDAADAAQETADEAKGIAETAIQTVKVNNTALTKSGTEVNITALTAVDSDTAGSNGITISETADKKVTLSVTPATYTPATETVAGSWSSESDVVKASDVKAAITDAINAIPDVTTSSDAQTVGVTASDNVVSVDTADYTKASETGEIGTWTPATKGYLVTGATVADAIGDVNAKIDALHQTPQFKVVVVDGVTDLTKWQDSVTGGIQENYIYLVENIDAADGSYIEYIAYKNGETLVTERIGTTKTDLSGYAKTAELNVTETTANGLTYSQTNGVVSASVAQASTSQVGTVQLTNTYTSTEDDKAATGKSIAAAIATLDTAAPVGEGAVKVSQTDGIVSSVTVDTEVLVDNNAIKESTTSDTALITAKDALAAIKLAKPENYVKSVTVGSTTTSGETALTINDGRENVYANDLWPTTVSMVGNTVTVQSSLLDGSNWHEKFPLSNSQESANGFIPGFYSYEVRDNKLQYANLNETLANIQTNELVYGRSMFESTSLTSFSGDLSSLIDGRYMFYHTPLESFSGDLSSLVNGYAMFDYTSLASFSGDLSSLVNGDSMFANVPLTSFSDDLISLVNGNLMFSYTSLASFSGDLSNLVNGSQMFKGAPLASFSGDLSNLVNGSQMFQNTPLESFTGDLSSLVNGDNMFNDTDLESFSGDLSSLVTSSNMFAQTHLTSFSGDLSSLVDGSTMFQNTYLESFSGDLSSLVNGNYMFQNTSLDVESVELICDVLPNYNTENGGKKLQTATWNESGENKGKYTYNDWTSGRYYYPIIEADSSYNSMSHGNVDGIDRSFNTMSIYPSYVKTISITWVNISVLSEADRTTITKLFTDTATEKGWTFITNTELGGTVSPNAIMAADGTIQYYILAKKDEATEDNATHIDASGKLWKFDTAEAIIGPNIKYWSMFATVEDALTEWELTPWAKPTE